MKTPQAWTESKSVRGSTTGVTAADEFGTPYEDYTAFTKPKVVEAASMNMGESVAGVGKCPACRVPMTKLFDAQFPMQICVGCRISLPLKDEKETN